MVTRHDITGTACKGEKVFLSRDGEGLQAKVWMPNP